MGAVLEANFRNWDLAVEGSPSSSTLMSPRLHVPSGSCCNALALQPHAAPIAEDGAVHTWKERCRSSCWCMRMTSTTPKPPVPLNTAAHNALMMKGLCVVQRVGSTEDVPHLARAAKEQAGDSLLDPLRAKDLGSDALGDEVEHIGPGCKLPELSLFLRPASTTARQGIRLFDSEPQELLKFFRCATSGTGQRVCAVREGGCAVCALNLLFNAHHSQVWDLDGHCAACVALVLSALLHPLQPLVSTANIKKEAHLDKPHTCNGAAAQTSPMSDKYSRKQHSHTNPFLSSYDIIQDNGFGQDTLLQHTSVAESSCARCKPGRCCRCPRQSPWCRELWFPPCTCPLPAGCCVAAHLSAHPPAAPATEPSLSCNLLS